MKIDLGYGAYLESDDGPRDSAFHRQMIVIRPIPGTRAGHDVTLECGHRVQTFGDIERAGGRVLCTQCRDGR